MLSKWQRNDDTIPKRDVIVQCCFYFGKNVEETNRLLMAGEYEQLYILDVVDVIAMYYLDKYCGNFEIPAFEKLKEVKEKINIALERCYKEREDIVLVSGFKPTKLSECKLTEEEKKLLQVLKPNWDNEKVFFEIIPELKEEQDASASEKINIKVNLEREYELEKNME